jgi:hypothetical protein
MKEGETITVEWPEIECTAQFARYKAYVDFAVFQIAATTAKSQEFPTGNCYAMSDSEHTGDLSKAEPLVKGTIKWDACSHLYFGNEGYIHTCGHRDWLILQGALCRVWNQVVPEFQEPHQAEYFSKLMEQAK